VVWVPWGNGACSRGCTPCPVPPWNQASGGDATCAIYLPEGFVDDAVVPRQVRVERPTQCFSNNVGVRGCLKSFLKASLEHYYSTPYATLAGAAPSCASSSSSLWSVYLGCWCRRSRVFFAAATWWLADTVAFSIAAATWLLVLESTVGSFADQLSALLPINRRR
jgi:hypothetical protein